MTKYPTTIITALLIFGSLVSQTSPTRNIRINIYNLEISREEIHVDLNSQAENLNLCSIQVIDSTNQVVQTGKFPPAKSKAAIKQWTANTFSITELAPGKYTLLLFIGREEFYRRGFRRLKDNQEMSVPQ
jgi:hypothetical protein